MREKPKAYDSQTVEVAGITYESVAHGTFYRGDAKKQDGFYLHIKITNNNTKNRTNASRNKPNRTNKTKPINSVLQSEIKPIITKTTISTITAATA